MAPGRHAPPTFIALDTLRPMAQKCSYCRLPRPNTAKLTPWGSLGSGGRQLSAWPGATPGPLLHPAAIPFCKAPVAMARSPLLIVLESTSQHGCLHQHTCSRSGWLPASAASLSHVQKSVAESVGSPSP